MPKSLMRGQKTNLGMLVVNIRGSFRTTPFLYYTASVYCTILVYDYDNNVNCNKVRHC